MGDLKSPVSVRHEMGAKLGAAGVSNNIVKNNPIKGMARKLRGAKGAQLPDVDRHESHKKAK